jgi:arylsulfatase A-like enzyme
MNTTFSRRAMLGGVAAMAQAAPAAPASTRRNVIMILFDDLGTHDLGFLGAKDLQTPHIDWLAAGGTVCENWY